MLYTIQMCYNCGCRNPDDDMGNGDNITNDTFHHLSEHWKTSDKETKEKVLKMLEDDKQSLRPDGLKITDDHLVEMFEKAAKAWGQSVDDAKKKTKNMLEDELEP